MKVNKNRAPWLVCSCIVLGAFVLGALGIMTPVAAGKTNKETTGRLVGVLITEKALDLWPDGIAGADAAHQDGRLYAERRTETPVDPETGEEIRHDVYAFEDLKGLLLYHAVFDGGEGQESYEATECDEAFADVTTHIFVTDECESVELEGTLYRIGAGAERTFHMNPVWQTDDGRLYVTNGYSFLHAGESAEEASWSTTLSEKTSVSLEGEASTRELTITLHVKGIREPAGVTLLRFDEQHRCIGRESYEENVLPEHIEVPAGTSWLLVETMTRAADGSLQIRRELCEPSGSAEEESYIELYRVREDGCAVKQQIPVVFAGR